MKSLIGVAAAGLFLSLSATQAVAQDDEIRAQCEQEVMGYGIADDDERAMAVQDCIESMKAPEEDSSQPME
jgi:hypothetical protein